MINLGIIGTNWITHSFVEAAHATGKYNLAAVYSRKEETAKEFASKYSGKQITTYTDLAALASSNKIDTMYIASPNILHYEQAKQFLSAGKNVILEKPSCSTVSELDHLFALAKENNVILVEAFRHIQEANFKLLKQKIADLGPLYGASITYAQYSSRYEKVLQGEVPNIFNLEMGGGALVDLGVYCVAAAVDLFGAPVDSQYWPVKIATGADGGGRLILTYPNFTVHLCHSKVYNSDAPSEIYGEKGTLIVPTITDIDKVTFWDPKKKTREDVAGIKTPEKLNLIEEAREFARCIEDRDEVALGKLEKHSRDTMTILHKVRHDNGLVFPGGK
ncbi:nad(P)-binding protein [Stemphylium lycopersici]|uniref:Nad(P)-binding protein n=1 Tax=Stemphylium lycopersici TaxID=183478 RepID=A0A364MVM0_STELY|nr:nad(P)-binding protein [Stemphylium lycopersici]RAR04476.1 nad(P)-binding protein [Stemphylium lycopersici]RAR04931.1 nad(P)-binding protein [Stemphylium lycopersici]